MSYVRFSNDSDVYAWTGGKYHTVMVPGNKLYKGKQEFDFDTIEQMRDFIQELDNNGYRVPKRTYEYIEEVLNKK